MMDYREFDSLPGDGFVEYYNDPVDGYKRGILPAEALFDPYVDEELDFRDTSKPTTEWDDELDKRIARVNPDNSFKPREEWEFLSVVMHDGFEAQQKLDARGKNLSEEERAKLELAVEDGKFAHENLFMSTLRLATWFTRESMGFHKERNQRSGKKPVRSNYGEGLIQDYAGASLSYSDRFQAVSMGLYKAIEKNDPDIAQITTYALYHMEQALLREIEVASEAYVTRIPTHIHYKIQKVLQEAQEEFNGSAVNAHDLSFVSSSPIAKNRSRQTQVTVEKIIRTAVSLRNVSLDDVAEKIQGASDLDDEDDQPLELGDLVRGEGDLIGVNEAFTSVAMSQIIDNFMSKLPENKKQILELRLGLTDLGALTLEEVGQQFGLTRGRIQQIEAEALSTLRHKHRELQVDKDVGSEGLSEQSGIREGVIFLSASVLEALGLRPNIHLDYSESKKRPFTRNREKFEYQEDWTED